MGTLCVLTGMFGGHPQPPVTLLSHTHLADLQDAAAPAHARLCCTGLGGTAQPLRAALSPPVVTSHTWTCPGVVVSLTDILTLSSSLTGGCSQLGVGLFSQLTRGRTRGNGLRLFQGKFRLHIREKFCTKSIVKLPRAVAKSPLKRHVDVALEDMV